MKISKFLTLAFLTMLFITACDKEKVATTAGLDTKVIATSRSCTPTTWNLIAGQNIDAGSVSVTNTATNLIVTYTLDYPGACFNKLHLWAGTNLANVPHNSQGIPVPGKFPYKADATGLTTYTFTIPLGVTLPQGCGTTIYVVAHSEIDMDCNSLTLNNQTGFGGDHNGSGNRWWLYGAYTVCCDFDNPPCPGETAWGGNSEGSKDGCNNPGNGAWWYYFDTQGPACQNIYVGQQLMNGGSICYANGQLTITLGGGWTLQNGSETVKVEGYNENLPTCHPAPGQFEMYKGTSLTVPTNGSRYYAVHLDVEKCE